MDPTPPPMSSPPTRPAGALRRRARLLAWVAAVLLLAGGLPAFFFALRGDRVLEKAALLQSGWLGLAGICLGLWSLLASTPPDAIRLSQRLGKRILLILGAALAGAALLWLVPLLSSEPLRHRYDGKIWLLGDNPYRTSPAVAAARARWSRDADDRPDALDAAAPHQGRTTLTLPAGQAFLTAGRAVEYLLPGTAAERAASRVAVGGEASGWRGRLDEAPWWRRLFAWRCVLAAAYLVTVGELITWLRQRGDSVWWAALFAWQPLVLLETVGMGHQDVLGVMFLVAGLRRAEAGRLRRGAICLAASVAVQPVALLALPLVLRQAGRSGEPADSPRRWRDVRRVGVWFAATLLLLLLPILSPTALVNLAAAVRQYAYGPSSNATLYRGLEWLFVGTGDPGRGASVRTAGWALCGAATLGAVAAAWLRRARPATGTYAALTAGLLLSPIAPPWALIWPLALVPALAGRGGLSALVWAGTAVLYYGGGLMESPWWQVAPVLAAAAAELSLSRRPPRPAG